MIIKIFGYSTRLNTMLAIEYCVRVFFPRLELLQSVQDQYKPVNTTIQLYI